MKEINDIILNNMLFIVPALVLIIIILFIIVIVMAIKNKNFKNRMEKFLGSKSERHNIEAMLNSYLHQVKSMNDIHESLLNNILEISDRVKFCVQKVGLVRYNPFDDVGGDLSFSLALLDQSNNGIVINNLYARDNCYTYAKPVKNGQADGVKFSDEELQAVNTALANSKESDE